MAVLAARLLLQRVDSGRCRRLNCGEGVSRDGQRQHAWVSNAPHIAIRGTCPPGQAGCPGTPPPPPPPPVCLPAPAALPSGTPACPPACWPASPQGTLAPRTCWASSVAGTRAGTAGRESTRQQKAGRWAAGASWRGAHSGRPGAIQLRAGKTTGTAFGMPCLLCGPCLAALRHHGHEADELVGAALALAVRRHLRPAGGAAGRES